MAKSEVNGSSRWRRRNYLINPTFQWKYILALGTGVFLVASLMGIALFGALHQQARARVMFPEMTSAWHNGRVLLSFALAFSVVTVAAFGCWGIILTHRISGPLFVLGGHLRKLGEGRFPEWRPLRKKDEFKDLYEVFWRASDSLKAEKQDELRILTAVLNAARSAATGDHEAHSSALESIASQVGVLRDRIAAALEQPVAAPSAAAPPLTNSGSRQPDTLVPAGCDT